MLRLVSSQREITHCQRLLKKELISFLRIQKRLTIGHLGGYFENKINFGEQLWYSTFTLKKPDAAIPRHWNGFGIEERKGGHQIIVVEINPPLNGIDGRVSGAFGKDDTQNRYYLLHRGGVGGGRKGIGKESFRSWYRGAWTTLYDEDGYYDEAILVGPLGTGELIGPLRTFVHEVANYKREMSEGKNSRKPGIPTEALDFTPESHGKRKGRRKSTFYYDSYHGAIVNALAVKLQTATGSVFNTKQIDLGVEISGSLIEIYEVKSSADLQSVYTALGQLIFHSGGDSSIRKILVLPNKELSQSLSNKLSELGIETLGYRIIKGEVIFAT